MTEKPEVPIRKYSVINVVEAKLAARMEDYRARLAATKSGYPVLTDWHPVIPDGWGEFPQAAVRRATVYRGCEETGAYNHHQGIAKLGDRYVVAWSNGFLHEDHVGQRVCCAWSADAVHWSNHQVIAATPPESRLVRNNAGLYSTGERLYCYVGVAEDFGRDVSPPGMTVLTEQRVRLDVYETTDLENWTHHEGICDNVYLFEGPRKTRGGKLMCCGSELSGHHGLALIWDDSALPSARPRVVDIPPSVEGVLPEQGTWYQTDDGVIWMYMRDSSISCRLALTWSEDEGETWSDLLRTDFPNTYSRAFAGRLNDGRYYIVGNNFDRLLDRRTLLIALSDDGRVFDRQYTLVKGDTTRRINGRHKEDGYHYPNCCADGDKLLVVYSVNKEDIEVISVDTRTME